MGIDGATASVKDGIGKSFFWGVEIGANGNVYAWTRTIDKVNVFVEVHKTIHASLSSQNFYMLQSYSLTTVGYHEDEDGG